MYKQLFLITLLFSSHIHSASAQSDLQKNLTLAVSTAAVAGSMYLMSKGYAHCVTYTAFTQFEPTRALLNYYAQYSNAWNPHLEQQLKSALKAEILNSHSKNRNRYAITIYGELLRSRPAYYVEKSFASFPLLQYKKDLDWYIKRLRIIHCFSLYSNNDALKILIDQLVYMRNIIMLEHDYYQEEQMYAQRGKPVCDVYI